MSDLSKNVAVQHEVLDSTKEKLETVAVMCEDTRRNEETRMVMLNDRLEEYRASARDDHQRLADHNAEKRNTSHNELMAKLDSMEKSLHSRINDQTKKINALENWRYYMMGDYRPFCAVCRLCNPTRWTKPLDTAVGAATATERSCSHRAPGVKIPQSTCGGRV